MLTMAKHKYVVFPELPSVFCLTQFFLSATVADANFKYIFWNENNKIPIWISLKFVSS